MSSGAVPASEWKWSPEHQDYYRVVLKPGGEYDYVWGRSTLPSIPNPPTNFEWEWAKELNDYYRVVQKQEGGYHYTWARPSLPTLPNPPSEPPPRYNTIYPNPPETSHRGYMCSGEDAQFHNDPESDDDDLDLYENWNRIKPYPYNTLSDRRYDVIQNPRSFFRKGRIFRVLWASNNSPSPSQQTMFEKVRTFVVIQPKDTYAICLAIHTYGGRGTSTSSVRPDDHAPCALEGQSAILYSGEAAHTTHHLREISVIIEAGNYEFDLGWRINFGRMFNIGYNIKVRKMGRVAGGSLERLQDYFNRKAGLQLQNEDQNPGG